MKIYEIREMNSVELEKRIAEEQTNLVDLQFAHQLKQLTNTAKLRTLRRDIARMNTVLEERKREAAKENSEGVKS